MFWTCEEFPPKDKIRQKRNTISTLKYLLGRLLNALKEGFLAYFFIPHINVIADIPKDVRLKACDKIAEILSNVTLSSNIKNGGEIIILIMAIKISLSDSSTCTAPPLHLRL